LGKETALRWQDDNGTHFPFKRLNVKLPAELHAAFLSASAADGRSMQVLTVDLVKQFINGRKKK